MSPLRRRAIRAAYETKDPERRRQILETLRVADYSPGFLDKVQDKKFKHPETGNKVKFISLPKDTQAEIYKGLEGPSKHDPSTKDKSEKGLKYKDRKEIRGKGKEDAVKVALSDEDRATLVPDWMSEEDKKKANKALGKTPLAKDLRKFRLNIEKAQNNPSGPYMKGLEKSGYKPGDLAKMHATLRRVTEGRKYSGKLLPIWNEYDLEGEDADELYDFKNRKPGLGRKLDPEALKQKFLREASPETRERMKDLPIDEFMIAYKAIMDDEEEDET